MCVGGARKKEWINKEGKKTGINGLEVKIGIFKR